MGDSGVGRGNWEEDEYLRCPVITEEEIRTKGGGGRWHHQEVELECY